MRIAQGQSGGIHCDEFIMEETFSSVPMVNYSRLNNPATKDTELLKLREAIFVVGFLYLTNTGLEVRQLTFVRLSSGWADGVVRILCAEPTRHCQVFLLCLRR